MSDDRELDELFALIRQRQAPADARLDAIWGGLRRRIADGDLGPRMCDVEVRRRSPWHGVAMFGGAAALLALASGWIVLHREPLRASSTDDAKAVQASHERMRNTPAMSASVLEPVEAPRAPTRSRLPPEDLACVPPPPGIAMPPPAPLDPPVAAPRRVRKVPPHKQTVAVVAPEDPSLVPHAPVIAAEVAALSAARRALARGDPESALAVVSALDQGDAALSLAPERSALEVAALCALGRVDAARSKAARFVARFPDSPLGAKVAGLCRR